jgi:hypothetical protein
VVASRVHPAVEHDLAADVVGAQLAAGVRATPVVRSAAFGCSAL